MSRVGDTMELGEDLDTHAELYRRMLLIRGFEDRVQSLFLRGEVYGTTHLYSGQEAVAVGFASVLGPDDRVACTYRGHGHLLAMGTDPEGLLAELLGRETGVNGGRRHSRLSGRAPPPARLRRRNGPWGRPGRRAAW